MFAQNYSIRCILVPLAALALGVLAMVAVSAENEQLVLLTNGNVLVGVTEVNGDLIVVHRDDGSQLRLRREQVTHVAATHDELYQYRVGKRNFHDANIHAEDARWCLRYGLIDQAETELRGLQTLDPSHPEAIRLQRQIQSARQPRAVAPASESVGLIGGDKTEVSGSESIALPDGISPASMIAFATQVQPLLINRCGNSGCHRTGSATKWQLSHLGVNVRVSAKTSQRNIGGVLAYVNINDPLSSELLRYMTTPHGDGRYEPTGHSAQAAEATLRYWLTQFGRNLQPSIAKMETPVTPAAYNARPAVPIVNAGVLPNTESLADGFTMDADGELVYEPGKDQDAARPQRLPAVANPFSADLFNRRYQARRASE